jgi:5-methylcytosine-specific restriction enzyme subunit McrC
MIEISLTEGADWSPAHALTHGQAAAAASAKGIERRPLRTGGWQFRTHRQFPRIGAVRLGTGDDEVLVRIAPKLPVSRLMFLVQYAQQKAAADWDDSEITAREEEGLVSAMAWAFGRAAQRALHSGVLAGYQETDADATTVRGRIRTGDQARKGPTLGSRLAVSYDEFTADIPENRLLLTAAHQLRRLPGLRDDVIGMLDFVDKRLRGVRHIRPGEAWTPTRLNAHYYRALSIAQLVLRGNSYELDGDSGIRADGLLISMSHLFQDFVAAALDEAMRPHGGCCLARQEHYLDDRHLIRAQTDAAYYAPGDPDNPAAIIDAKYTVLGADGRSSRVQQMVSYCYKLGADHGYLIYAHGPEPSPVSHSVRDIVIAEYPLDLDQPPPELLGQISTLAATIAA